MKAENLRDYLDDLKAKGLYRKRKVVERQSGIKFYFEGRSLLNFSGNDYLGLADHPEVIRVMQVAAEKYGVGSGASHLISGHTAAHHALEEELADFTGREQAMLFSTGFMANQGIISALAARGDQVFEDRLNHASLLDGALLSGAKLKRYGHCDVDDLKGLLAQPHAGTRLIVTDGVFSMDGNLAPLPLLAREAEAANAWMVVDDAHGIGVIGAHGRGVLEHFGLSTQQVPILMGTLGKAFGTFGAFVAGDSDMIECLIQKARAYIYTTALPPAVAEATRASLKLVKEESWRREKLGMLIRQFRLGAKQLGLNLLDSMTPIQPLLIGENFKALRISHQLAEEGFLVTAIRPPTVPNGTARLRITLSALHEEEQVERLLATLNQVISKEL